MALVTVMRELFMLYLLITTKFIVSAEDGEATKKKGFFSKKEKWTIFQTTNDFTPKWDCQHLGTLCSLYDCSANSLRMSYPDLLPTESVTDTTGETKKHWTIKGEPPIDKGTGAAAQLLCTSYNPNREIFYGIVDIGNNQIRLAKIKRTQQGHEIEVIKPASKLDRAGLPALCEKATTLCNENARICHEERFEKQHMGYPAFKAEPTLFGSYNLALQDEKMEGNQCSDIVCFESTTITPWSPMQAIVECGTDKLYPTTVWFHGAKKSGRFRLSQFPHQTEETDALWAQMALSFEDFMTQQIGSKGADGTPQHQRWKDVENRFPVEIRGIKYWGDMKHLVTKALVDEKDLKFFTDLKIFHDWPKFDFGNAPWMKAHVEQFRDCKFEEPATGDKHKRCQEMSWSPWDVAAHAIKEGMWVSPGKAAGGAGQPAGKGPGEKGPQTTKGPDGTVTTGKKEKTVWEKVFGSSDDKSPSTMSTPSVLIAVVVVGATVALSFYFFAN